MSRSAQPKKLSPTVEALTFRHKPDFPPITEDFARFLEEIDSEPAFVARVRRIIAEQDKPVPSRSPLFARAWRRLTHR